MALLRTGQFVVGVAAKVMRGVLMVLSVACVGSAAHAVDVEVQPTVVGDTPETLGMNPSHFMHGSNTHGWWAYSQATGVRFFSSAKQIEPDDDIEGHGDGVVTFEDFEARKSALRADHVAEGEPSDTYVNWSYFDAKFATESVYGEAGDGNVLSWGHTMDRLRDLGQTMVMAISAKASVLPIIDEDDWAGKWELWQHYYARAYHHGRYYDVERYQMYNEPNHSNGDITMEAWMMRLKLASDAIQCALDDVNAEYGKSLQAAIQAPVNAGGPRSSSGVVYGDAAIANRHVDYKGDEDPNFWTFHTYSYNQYNNEPNNFGDRLAWLKDKLRTDIPEASYFPVAISEFNVHTGGRFDGLLDTMDTPMMYARLGGIFQQLAVNGIDEMYCFKFSDATKEQYVNYLYQKNALYYADSDSVPHNVGGANRGGEVARLFYKGFAPGRTLLQTTNGEGGDGLYTATTYDSTGGVYSLFSTNYHPDTPSDTVVSFDLSALNIPYGNAVVIEEVSSAAYGSVVMKMDMPANGIITRTQPAQSVWLLTVSGPLQGAEQVLTAVEDVHVRDGIHNTVNYGSATRLEVRNDWTTKDNRRTALMKFDLSGVNVAEVESAVLTLPAAAMSETGDVVQAYAYALDDSDWSEGDVTWSSAPNLSSPEAGDKIVNKFVDGIGDSADVLGQVVVSSTTVADQCIDVTDYIRGMSADQLSVLVAQDPRWNQTLPTGPAGDQQADGLVITSTEGGVGPQLKLRMVSYETPTYAIAYDGNGNTGGTAPSGQVKTYAVDLTLAVNSGVLVKAGSIFTGWNTEADGSGKYYPEGAVFSANAPMTLYALWTPLPDDAVLINFQPADAPTVLDAMVDAGDVFGNRGAGQFYGWDSDNFEDRDRGLLSNQLLDTLNHFQKRGDHVWELARANGYYEVTLTCGDPAYDSSINDFEIEGVLVSDLDGGDHLDVHTAIVQVLDERLTIAPAASASGAKINAIKVRPVSIGSLAINFQPADSAMVPSYLIDSGEAFGDRGNGQIYGWDIDNFRTRDRGVLGDPLLDTLNHAQKRGVRAWEWAVANGDYEVVLTCGDPLHDDMIHDWMIEDRLVSDPDGFDVLDVFTQRVTVADGRLTLIPAATAVNAKINALEVRSLLTESNVAPTAQVAASIASGVGALAVDFSSLGSSDSDGVIISYAWDFGDGNGSNEVHPSHYFEAPGDYVVTLTVMDDEGATSTDSITIAINAAPIGQLTASITGGVAPLVVDFSSAGSSDSDGTIVSYAWDFGDGSVSGEQNDSHIFTVPGTYVVKLTVIDDEGALGIDATRVVVTDGSPQPEGVLINFQPAEAPTVDGYLVDAGDVFGDRDNGHSYGWNADNFWTRDRELVGDQLLDTLNHFKRGYWELELANGDYDVTMICGDPMLAGAINDYDIEGVLAIDPDGKDNFDVHNVMVSVTDGRLTIARASTAVSSKISAVEVRSIPNVPPIAHVEASTTEGVAELTVDFSAAGSTDSDGTIVSYAWDFGDGSVSSEVDPSYAFTTAGVYVVTLTVTDDDGAEGVDSTTITVTDPPEPVPVLVNFQPADAPTVDGYLVDAGDAFGDRGNGHSYGWDSDNFRTRDREMVSNQLLDTLNHCQKRGTYQWELAVDDGDYEVTLICGDPEYDGSINDFEIEGVLVSDPDGGDNLDVYTVVVLVTDGRLTIAPAATASGAKVNAVEVRPVPAAVAINFQPADAPTVDGYLVDAGDAFGDRGNGQSYGWDSDNFQTRDRELISDQLLDTLNHCQKRGTYQWELAVDDGDYEVTLTCGDPGYTNSINDFEIEGVLVSDSDGGDNLDVYTVIVSVADGRLTIVPAATGSGAKINAIEVRLVVSAPTSNG